MRFLCIGILFLTVSCGLSTREVTVQVTQEPTLNTLTIEDTAAVTLPPITGPKTAPIRILWTPDTIVPPTGRVLHLVEIAVERDSVYVYGEESRMTFLAPVPGETLRIQQGADSTVQAFLEGEPETEEFTFEVRERQSLLDKAEMSVSRWFTILGKVLIGIVVIGVVTGIGFVTFKVIEAKKKREFTKGLANLATDILKDLVGGTKKRK